MEGKTIAIFLIAALIFGGVMVALGSIPTSAFSGGQQTTVCTLKLSASGNYNDLLVAHYVSDFAVTGGGTSCHTQTLLDLVPSSQFNLFPVTLTFSVVLTSQRWYVTDLTTSLCMSALAALPRLIHSTSKSAWQISCREHFRHCAMSGQLCGSPQLTRQLSMFDRQWAAAGELQFISPAC